MPALCAECGAPRDAHAARCARCGAEEPSASPAPLDHSTNDPKVQRAWRLAVRSTVVFVLAEQAVQWTWIAVRGASAFSLARALLTLAVALWAGARLARRDAAALVVWGWVMVASALAMALTFAGALRWTRMPAFDVALTGWAWAGVLGYAAVLRGVRRVVLGEAVR